MTEAGSPLLVSFEKGILQLTLNRPRRFNALDGDLIDRLEVTLREEAGNEGIRVLILSGRRRAFCFGADLSGLPPDDEERGSVLDTLLPRFQTVIVRPSPGVDRNCVGRSAPGAETQIFSRSPSNS